MSEKYFSDESRDTSPLELEQLSNRELAAIIQIERRLFEAQQSVRTAASEQRVRHYIAPVEVRHARVLLLDGGRGTGKTSLLLTLVHRWTPDNGRGVERHDSDVE